MKKLICCIILLVIMAGCHSSPGMWSGINEGLNGNSSGQCSQYQREQRAYQQQMLQYQQEQQFFQHQQYQQQLDRERQQQYYNNYK